MSDEPNGPGRVSIWFTYPSQKGSMPVGARQKLNTAHGCGIVLISLLVAGVFQSWAVFLIVVGLLTLAAMNNGDIRTSPRRR